MVNHSGTTITSAIPFGDDTERGGTTNVVLGCG